MSGFYPDPLGTTVCVTCASQLANCATCEKTALGVFSCLTCAVDTFWTGSTCFLCSITNCITHDYVLGACTCIQCAAGYIPNGANGCSLCSSYITSCQECDSQTNCILCSPTMFFNTGNVACETCPLLGCSVCSTVATCATCDAANDYFLIPGDTCQQCTLN